MLTLLFRILPLWFLDPQQCDESVSLQGTHVGALIDI